MEEKDKNILIHIKEYCFDIITFINRFGKNYSTFCNDKAYINAISMCVFQIGELSVNLSDEFKAESINIIPWSNIKGMRNVIAHGYGTIEIKKMWETAIYDVPLLLEFCTNKIDNFLLKINK